MRSRGILLAAKVMIGIVMAPPGFAAGIEVTSEGAARTAVQHFEGCQASLRQGREKGHYDYRNSCQVPMAAKLASLRELASVLRGEASAGNPPKSLGLGRLIRYPELARQLALAADRSDDWDSRLGKPAAKTAAGHGAANRLVAALLRDGGFLLPLAGALAGKDDDVAAVEVEKVLIGRPADTLFAAWLIEEGVRPDARVPFDAIVWLTLRR